MFESEILYLVLAPILFVAYILFTYAAYRSRAPDRKLYYYPLVASCITAFVVVVPLVFLTIISGSSTAAIGFIFLPKTFVLATTTIFSVVYILSYLEYVSKAKADRLDKTFHISRRIFPTLFLIVVLIVPSFFIYSCMKSSEKSEVCRNDPIKYSFLYNDNIEMAVCMAKNPQLSHDKLTYIYTYCKPALLGNDAEKNLVLRALAGNFNTPLEILSELATARDKDTRLAVARNPYSPVKALVLLSKDEDTSIRSCVAMNTNMPIDKLHELERDTDEMVRKNALETLKKINPTSQDK